MSVSQADVVDYIKNLKLSEVKALIETLEDELGVEASAPAVAMAAGPAAVVEEQTEFDVVMKSFGQNKISVIKAVRALTGLGLKEAKGMVESAPVSIKEAAGKDECAEIQKSIEEAGGKVELK